MAYPYPYKSRHNFREIHTADGSVTISDITPTGGSVDFNLPPGAYSIQVSVWGASNDKPATLTIAPYVDPAQTLLAGNNKFLAIGSTTAAVTITVPTATATAVGAQYLIIQAGDQYGAAAPVMSLAGSKMTIATTATSGVLHYSYIAMEW